MLIAFWSTHYREETAQMLTLIGGMCCRRFPCTIVGVENYLHTHNLGFHMLGSRYDSVRRGAKRGSSVYYKAGEIYVRHVCNEMGRVFRKDSVIPADGNGLMFMPMDQSLYEDSYRFMMHEILDQQIDYLENQYDDVYLNLEAGNNDTTIEMLDRAEVVVVCLPANPESFDEFYDRYRSLVDKCFFIFFGSGGMPESLQTRFLQYLPSHVPRSCYVEMTRLLQNYLFDGRGLDYLDLLFTGSPPTYRNRDSYMAIPGTVAPDVAEEAGEYRSGYAGVSEPRDEFIRWKNETDRRIGDEALSAVRYGVGDCMETERGTITSLRHIVDWLIRYEHREIGSDCSMIAEHLLRRKYVSKEVFEWRAQNRRK